jgi:hypothetical protein
LLSQVAAAAGIPAVTLARASDLAGALKGEGLPGTGIRMVEVRTGRAAGTALRARLRAACTAAATRSGPG